MEKSLKLSILENSHDFVKRAVKFALQEDSTSWKFALLNLHSGLELLLKARLELEHWSLLFSKIDEASSMKLKQGNFQSVTFNQLLNRLKEIVDRKINEKDEVILNSTRNTRNQIEHFMVDISLEHLKAKIATGLNVYIEFYRNNFSYKKEFISDLLKDLSNFNKFVSNRIKTISAKIQSSDRPRFYTDCHNCLQNALIKNYDEDLIECLFCYCKFLIKEIADYGYRSKLEIEICPECKNKSLNSMWHSGDIFEFNCIWCPYNDIRIVHR